MHHISASPKQEAEQGGTFFLSDNKAFPCNNGIIHNIAKVIRAVMSSAARAELGTLFTNAKQVMAIWAILADMGHPQPPMSIQTDNSTAMDIITNTILPKATKAMDMRFHGCRTKNYKNNSAICGAQEQ